jgi:hypothetical protein
LPRKWRTLLDQVPPIAQGEAEVKQQQALKAHKIIAQAAARERRRREAPLAVLLRFLGFGIPKKPSAKFAVANASTSQPAAAHTAAFTISSASAIDHTAPRAGDPPLSIATPAEASRGARRVITIGVLAVVAIAGAWLALSTTPTKEAEVQKGPEPIHEVVTTPGSSPLPPIPDYCTDQDHCVFRAGYSLWRVAGECFGEDPKLRTEGVLRIWDLNRETLRDPDPNRVWEGETFKLPVSVCPARE